MNTAIVGGPGYSGPAINIADRECRDCAEWRDKPGRCVFWARPAARKQLACIAFGPKEEQHESSR